MATRRTTGADVAERCREIGVRLVMVGTAASLEQSERTRQYLSEARQLASGISRPILAEHVGELDVLDLDPRSPSLLADVLACEWARDRRRDKQGLGGLSWRDLARRGVVPWPGRLPGRVEVLRCGTFTG